MKWVRQNVKIPTEDTPSKIKSVQAESQNKVAKVKRHMEFRFHSFSNTIIKSFKHVLKNHPSSEKVIKKEPHTCSKICPSPRTNKSLSHKSMLSAVLKISSSHTADSNELKCTTLIPL